MIDIIKLVAQSTDEGKRLDVFLSENLEVSRNQASLLIVESETLKKYKQSYRVKEAEEFTVHIEKEQPREVLPEDMNIVVLYEDEYMAIVNKSSGISMHPDDKSTTGTLVNGLLYRFSRLSDLQPERSGIVHRLDKDTSGAVIIAKTNEFHELITENWHENVTRIYHTVVRGRLGNEQFYIEKGIERSNKNRKKMIISDNGKYSKTIVQPVVCGSNTSFAACELVTGRAHQIRVHMSSVGHPVIGDPMYGSKVDTKKADTIQALHARLVAFTHPITKKQIKVIAPYEEEFSLKMNSVLGEEIDIDKEYWGIG